MVNILLSIFPPGTESVTSQLQWRICQIQGYNNIVISRDYYRRLVFVGLTHLNLGCVALDLGFVGLDLGLACFHLGLVGFDSGFTCLEVGLGLDLGLTCLTYLDLRLVGLDSGHKILTWGFLDLTWIHLYLACWS